MTGPPADGLPAWGPEADHNVQFDTRAAQILTATATRLTLVTLPVTLKAHLRAADLPRLRASGPLGELLARQGEAHGEDHGMAELGRAHAGLPDDLLNFHYDPVACAVAAGWTGAVIQELRLRPVLEGGVLRFQPDPDGRLMRVVADLDGASFTDTWLGLSRRPNDPLATWLAGTAWDEVANTPTGDRDLHGCWAACRR
jgi:purine nucleosidase